MIVLLESTQLLNIGIDLFSAILILVLFLDDRRIYERTYDMILFSAFEISYIAFSLSDMFTWMFDGMPSSAARGAVYFFNIVFMFMQCVCFGIWVLYVRYRLNHSLLSQRLKNFTAATLSILAVLLFR